VRALGPASLREAVGRRAWRFWKRLVLERNGRFGTPPRPEKWVFVVGCYNSGTTLLHDLLAAQPLIGSMPDEGQFFQDQLPLPRDFGLRRLWALRPELFRLDEAGGREIDVARLKRQWGAHFNDPTRPVLLEKSTPNAARTRWLERRFEPASFIGIVRDGRAVAEGIRRATGCEIGEAARQWVGSNDIMLRDFDKLARKRLITYERLTAAPDEVLAELLRFLDLPGPVEPTAGREWTIHKRSSAIRNMNPDALRRLTREDLVTIEAVAGPALATLGYAPERPVA
jgi:hypothetical protein